jgi:hypothetical protein
MIGSVLNDAGDGRVRTVPDSPVRRWRGSPRAWPVLQGILPVGFVADPVADEAEPGQGFFGQLALGRIVACQHGVVDVEVMADQCGVDDGDPPHRLTDHRERPRPVPCGPAGEPSGGVAHRGDGPLQGARPGLQIASVLASASPDPAVMQFACRSSYVYLSFIF